MWIEELPNGKYKFCERYEDPLTGKLKKVSVTNVKKTKDVREQMLIKLNKRIEKILSENNHNDMTFREAYEAWNEIQKQKVKPSTILKNKTYLSYIISEIGDTHISKITAAKINKLILESLQSKRYAYVTAKQIMSLIKRIIIFASKYEGINKMEIIPFLEVPKINITKVDDFKYLEKEELKSVIKYLDDNDLYELKRMVEFQVSTGMRYGEMVSIDYDKNIDFDNKSIHIKNNYDFNNRIFTTPKNGKDRIIYFNDTVEKIIKEQIVFDKEKIVRYGIDRNNTLLFKNLHGKPIHIEVLNKNLRKIKINNKRVSSHYLRHTFITMAVQDKIDKDLIARQVGHSDTNMIDKVYSHFTNEMENQQKEAMLDFKII